MAAPSRNEAMVKELVAANVEAMKALTDAVGHLSQALAARDAQTQVIGHPGSPDPQISFEDLPEDEWDKPERLWAREEEEDAEFTEAVDAGDQIDPGFLAEVLVEAGLDPNIKLN